MDNISCAVTVRQLNLYVKSLIEGDMRLRDITVKGELSNFKRHYASGHWYFTLKDDAASVRGVMFRSAAIKVNFDPCDGMLVTVRGRISLYEKDGQYQFYAEEMHEAGEGDLALQFEMVRKKLEAEGLFDPESKRPLPEFPSRIAVITSETGAAIRDILNVLSRRYPMCEVVMCPASVQGESAVSEMIAALDRVYSLDGIDTIIIGRGGGSAEDLSAFNSEALARKIYESPVPVISAVGHEIDFTICDFVADLRAPTPSAAAELAVPDGLALRNLFDSQTAAMTRALRNKYELLKSRYNAATNSYLLKRPLDMLSSRSQSLDLLSSRLSEAMRRSVENRERMFSTAISSLEALSPLKTLSRGYAVVKKGEETVSSAKGLESGDAITVIMKDACAECRVESVSCETYADIHRKD